jgi:tetrahydromethanopterin S-methyltransferase subunit G
MASLETIEALLERLTDSSEKRLSALEDEVYGSMGKRGIISLLYELEQEREERQRTINRHLGALWAVISGLFIALIGWISAHLRVG